MARMFGVAALIISLCAILTGSHHAGAQAASAGDAAAGKAVFQNVCSSCHSSQVGGTGFGPSLAGVYGRHAGTLPGYKYSDGMANASVTWDETSLNSFLTNTTKFIPGTAMSLEIADPAERANVIAYLKTLGTTSAAAAAPSESVVNLHPSVTGPSNRELLDAASDANNWLYTSKDYAGDRFSNLTQVTAANAPQLRPVCIYRSNNAGATQSALIVYNGVMYLTIDQSIVALDATTCRQRWTYTWQSDGPVISATNRGVAIMDGRVVRGTSDGHLIAVDMGTGKLLWSRKIASAQSNQYLSMPPLIYDGLVMYGAAGGDWGSRDWVGAFRLDNGEPVWRFYLIPDVQTGTAEGWNNAQSTTHGGAGVWTPLSLDAKKGVLYVPVGNPAPDFYGNARPGSNLYTDSVVALDAHTGKMIWYHQFVAHDTHDSDLSQVSPLFSAASNGNSRDLIAVSGKDGLLRLMDRDTQQVLYEIPITTRTNVNSDPTVAGVHRCPGLLGGMEWNGPAYDPKTNTLFVASVDWCGTFKLSDTSPHYTQDEHYYGGSVAPDPAADGRGWLYAIDATTGNVRWRRAWPTPLVAGVTATAGGVLFTGDLNNNFLAIDEQTGNTLYSFNSGGSIGGGVVTYAVGNKQYVATTSGVISGFFGGSGTSAVIVFSMP
jgi:alcohol dehydrogenase (cytochrome c)